MADSSFDAFTFLRSYLEDPNPEKLESLKPDEIQEIVDIAFTDRGGMDREIRLLPFSIRDERFHGFHSRFLKMAEQPKRLFLFKIKVGLSVNLEEIPDLETTLGNAAFYGHLETIKSVLSMRPEMVNPEFLTSILYQAVGGCRIEVCNFLISQGADLADEEDHLLETAIRSRNLDIVRLFAPPPQKLYQAVKLASLAGSVQVLDYLLNRLEAETSVIVDYYKLYSNAVYQGHVAMVKYLHSKIDFHHPKIVRKHTRWLSIAIDQDYLEMIDYLVSKGVRLDNRSLKYCGGDSVGVRHYRELTR